MTEHFGGGEGLIFLDNVQCSGTEALLVHCQHQGANVHNCYHIEDVGVRCQGMCVNYYVCAQTMFIRASGPSFMQN